MTNSKSMAEMVDTYAQWSSSWVFVLAASGAAIGLNNVWQFPFLVSDYGGGAFIIVYIFCVLLIGAPLLIAEAMLGRRGRASPVNSIRRLAEHAGRRPAWGAIGWLGVGAGFLNTLLFECHRWVDHGICCPRSDDTQIGEYLRIPASNRSSIK